MRKLISAGIAFYMLDSGEKLTQIHGDRYGIPGYVIWPRGDKWDVRWYNNEWVEITDHQFDTENAAFNFAYEHFVARQAEMDARFQRK